MLAVAREVGELFDQVAALLLGDEARGRHGVDQKLQLRYLEPAVAQKIAVRLAHDRHYVHARIHEQVEVPLQRLAVRRNAVRLKIGENFRRAHLVLLVRLLSEELLEEK